MTNIKWKANSTANKKRAKKRIIFGSAKLYPALQARVIFLERKASLLKQREAQMKHHFDPLIDTVSITQSTSNHNY
jgi:hypothetical protein